MKKIIFLILLFLIAVLAIGQPSPPSTLVINNGGPVYPDTPALFDWNDCPGATSYGIQIFSGPTTILNLTGIPVSEYIVQPNTFSANTYCYCRLNATGPGGTSVWSSYFHFTVIPHNTLNPPALLSPPDSAMFISLTPTFDWSDVPGATLYRFQISVVPNFTTVVLSVSGLTNSGYVVTSPILTICMRYYWRVKTYNSGDSSLWSPVRTFTTICPTGINQISSKIPAEYKLYNNYPNPFNPSTNIRYQITNNRNTLLVIYDITGKEVITLVNEIQQPGIYEVTFDAGGLPSGVYFYKLYSGDFNDTKKMILIK